MLDVALKAKNSLNWGKGQISKKIRKKKSAFEIYLYFFSISSNSSRHWVHSEKTKELLCSSVIVEVSRRLHAMATVGSPSICLMKRDFLSHWSKRCKARGEDKAYISSKRSLASHVKPQICRLPCNLRHPWILNLIPLLISLFSWASAWWLPLAGRLEGHAAISLFRTPPPFLSLFEKPSSFLSSVVWKQEGGYSTGMCCRTLRCRRGGGRYSKGWIRRHLTFLLHASLGERESIGGGRGGGAMIGSVLDDKKGVIVKAHRTFGSE